MEAPGPLVPLVRFGWVFSFQLHPTLVEVDFLDASVQDAVRHTFDIYGKQA